MPVKTVHDKTVQGMPRHDTAKTRQFKTREGNTRQDKTTQCNTIKDKTLND